MKSAPTFSESTPVGLSGTNTGDVTLGAFGSAPSATGFSLSGQALSGQPADATHPGGVSILAQDFAGAKRFMNDLQTVQGNKLTFDGTTAAKYLSSDGTTLTLTGLNFFAPSITSNSNIVLQPFNSLSWSGLTLGFIANNVTTGMLMNSFGNTAGALQPGLGGTVYKGITPASNVSTGETTLDSFSVPANTLNANGRGLRFTAWGSYGATGNTKTIRLKFGATDMTAGAFTTTQSGGTWIVRATLLRTGATAQTAVADWGASSATPVLGKVTAPAETLSGAVTGALTGQSSAASNDVTSAALLIEALS